MGHHHIDPQSLSLIIELQLSDIDPLLKGKRKHGETNDLEAAVAMYKSELEALDQFARDRAMSRSIARAARVDGAAIASHNEMEELARRDRLYALGLDEGAPYPSGDSIPSGNATSRGGGGQARNPYGSSGSSRMYGAESSSQAAKRAKSQPNGPPCTACGDSTPHANTARCPCSHLYCPTCIKALFSASTKDESLFPPRCCRQPIPLESVNRFLSADIIRTFHAKRIEFSTENRTYCHRPTCSTFIPPHATGNTAACPACGSSTCTKCKTASHSPNPCGENDPATQEFLRMAGEMGWQRCRRCRRVVELGIGCYHMSMAPQHHTAAAANVHDGQPVTVVMSSATSAPGRGRRAGAPCGMSSGLSREPTT